MEYRRSEIRAGIFLLSAFAILVVMVFAVSDIQSLFKKKKEMKVVFSFSDGIEKNAQVRISGIKVGKVTDIRVNPDKGDQVELSLSVFSDAVVREDSKAAIKSLGLVGGKYVELTSGTSTAKMLKEGSVIKGEESLKMEDLTKAGMEVVNKLKNIAANLDRIAGDPEMAVKIKATIANVQDVTANVKTMTSSKDEVAAALKTLPEMIKKLDESIANLRDVSAKTDVLMGENRKQVDATMENMKEVSDNIKDFTAEVKKHPWKLLRKP
ncbi:MAG: MlaD family protein [Nitrospirota bacterium]|nr:MlaD family protein [Nitrospirota bacterium]